jgi:site-specific DNA recombinase
MPMGTTMNRVARYARYSSERQSDTSLEDQLALCQRHADSRGWTVVATFTDGALSGFGVEHRPGYQRLLVESAQHPRLFDIVLVEDLSRLTRDMAELLRLYHRLKLRGIELVGVSDGIATGSQGAKVQLAVKGLVNELYLDDLREKTHRGLSGALGRGLSTGGRTFGYRALAVSDNAGRKDRAPARIQIDPCEAEVVRQIFEQYAAGRSLKQIAYQLNHAGIPFPAKDTKRGPNRKGWAPSAIQFMLRNEKYIGRWIWNMTRFLKDPDTGRRRPLPRPESEWNIQARPELRILQQSLWDAVQSRLASMAQRFGRRGRAPGDARVAYSPHLLSGLLRCAECGARMHAVTFTRRKGDRAYERKWYVCGFAKDKGPAVCRHRVYYPREWLEGAIAEKFRQAMTPAVVDALVCAVNATVASRVQLTDSRTTGLRSEIARLEVEASNLVKFLREGKDSPTVRAELERTDNALQQLRAELVQTETRRPGPIPHVHRTWVLNKLQHLHELLNRDPGRAKAEVMKHLDGDLRIRPLPSPPGNKRAEISGTAKPSSLLATDGQEAAFATMVAGAGFEPATFGL